jgi:hypothetical protein
MSIQTCRVIGAMRAAHERQGVSRRTGHPVAAGVTAPWDDVLRSRLAAYRLRDPDGNVLTLVVNPG